VDGFGFRCGRLFIVAMVARFEGSRAGRGCRDGAKWVNIILF
jgi:hypothetical protein